MAQEVAPSKADAVPEATPVQREAPVAKSPPAEQVPQEDRAVKETVQQEAASSSPTEKEFPVEPLLAEKEAPLEAPSHEEVSVSEKKKTPKPAHVPEEPIQEEVSHSAVAKKTASKNKNRKKLPLWGWIALLITLGVIGFLGFQYFEKKQEISLSWTCAKNLLVAEDTPLEISYGYWGALNSFYQQNYDSIRFQLYIDGKRYYGERQKKPLKLKEIPCGTSTQFDAYFEENRLWIYDVAIIEGLPAGKYQVDIFTYADFNIADGTKDNNGNLNFFGPGLLFKTEFTLIVQ